VRCGRGRSPVARNRSGYRWTRTTCQQLRLEHSPGLRCAPAICTALPRC